MKQAPPNKNHQRCNGFIIRCSPWFGHPFRPSPTSPLIRSACSSAFRCFAVAPRTAPTCWCRLEQGLGEAGRAILDPMALADLLDQRLHLGARWRGRTTPSVCGRQRVRHEALARECAGACAAHFLGVGPKRNLGAVRDYATKSA